MEEWMEEWMGREWDAEMEMRWECNVKRGTKRRRDERGYFMYIPERLYYPAYVMLFGVFFFFFSLRAFLIFSWVLGDVQG